ncbi:MAG: HAMP domain-containing protein [Gammaproteobacteria bacterium]|nr:HAMP domain-containing protein [Gammaproteobacteria bacterium]
MTQTNLLSSASVNMFNKLKVGQKLAVGYGAVLLILIALVAFIEYKLVGQEELQNSIVELRVPTNIAGHDLVNGVNYSLAALRGYMILGKERFKQQRQDAWKDIDKNLDIMTEMSKSWTVPKNVEKLQELKIVFREFRKAQQQIENISHSEDEQPAMKILLNEAAPKAQKVIMSITDIINEEKKQDATSARKALLVTFADSRGSFAMGLASIRAFLISGEPKWVDDFNQRWEVNTARLETIKKNSQILTSTQQEHLNIYISNREAFAPLPQKMFDIRGSNKWNMANFLLGTEAAPRAGKILKHLAEMVASQNQLVADDVSSLKEESSFVKTISIVATLIALVIGSFIGWYISKTIVGSLTEAMAASERIAGGDLSIPIESNSQDETGQLLRTMSQLQEKLTQVIEIDIQSIVDTAKSGDLSQRINLDNKDGFYEKLSSGINELVDVNESVIDDTVRMFEAMANGDLSQTIETEYQGAFDKLKQDANRTVAKLTQVIEGDIQELVNHARKGNLSPRISLDDKEGFFDNLSQGVNDLVEVSERVVEDTMRMFGALAEGDLTKSIDSDYQGSFMQLKNDANRTVNKLTEIITEIRGSASSVATGAKEISGSNLDLSQRTEEQASSLEETAASMEEMTSSVRNSADNAKNASDLASDAQVKAESGGEVVARAVGAMEEINDSSNKISDIIGVIDEIAFQTNLLALNAAVEAARAGEQGRGFAVVAAEVRNLAQRSAGAAKEIKELIRDSVGKVEDGSKLVNESGNTLSEIVQAVQQVSVIINDISSSAQEQSNGIDQVNTAVSQMDETTQQNAGLVEEASAASENMAEQAGLMNELMDFFTTDERRVETVVHSPVEAVGQDSKVNTSNSTKIIEEDSEDGWEEF